MRPRAPSLELTSSEVESNSTSRNDAPRRRTPPRGRMQSSGGLKTGTSQLGNSTPDDSSPVSQAVRKRPIWSWSGQLKKGVLVAVFSLVACIPPTPAQKATDAARELNMGARWGRMTEAAALAAPKERAEFSKRRTQWHGEVRIVETELSSLNMKDATHATVHVDVSWMFVDDPTLRTTRLKQEWSDADGKWVMLSEKTDGGDPGLFGEDVKKAEVGRDVHFPSRVIH